MPPRRPTPAILLPTLLFAPATAFTQDLPPGEAEALERLNTSPRHGEWVTYLSGPDDEVTAWIVYPERSDAAPVVVVIHEIFGLTDWIRAVADQAAAEGYIAIAPDLLSGEAPNGGGSATLDRQAVVRVVRDLERDDVNRRLRAAARYAMALPAAAPRVAAVGFCWGGSASFELAADFPDLDGAVVYYGSSPDSAIMAGVEAPVLGLYGGADNRVNATIPRTRAAMEGLGKRFEPVIFDGAGHGFLRAQKGQDGDNRRATVLAWPRTMAFFREVLGR